MRVLVCERELMFRELLSLFLDQKGYQVVKCPGLVQDLHDTLVQGCPDVVLIDDGMPAAATSEELRRLASRQPLPEGVRALRGVCRGLTAVRPRRDRARRRLPAAQPARRGVEWVISGRRGVAPSERGHLGSDAQRDQGSGHRRRTPVTPPLTAREREVMECLVAGMSTRAIACRLGVTTTTVHTHVQGVLRKLGVRSRLAAVSMYLRTPWAADELVEA